MKYSEKIIQAHLLRRLIWDNGHVLASTNFKGYGVWECDVLSVTRSHMAHEFEIKVSKSDFRADAKKRKHNFYKAAIKHGVFRSRHTIPNRLWYVMPELGVEKDDVPDYAGLMTIKVEGTFAEFEIIKKAPLIHNAPIGQARVSKIHTALVYKLVDIYSKAYIESEDE